MKMFMVGTRFFALCLSIIICIANVFSNVGATELPTINAVQSETDGTKIRYGNINVTVPNGGNEQLFVTLLNPKVDGTAYTAEEFEKMSIIDIVNNRVINCFWQEAMVEGTYAVNFKMTGGNGSYAVIVGSPAIYGTLYTSLEYEDSLWEEFNAKRKATGDGALSAFKTFMENETIGLGLDITEYRTLTNDEKENVCIALMQCPTDYTTTPELNADFKKMVIYAYLMSDSTDVDDALSVINRESKIDNSVFSTTALKYGLSKFTNETKQYMFMMTSQNTVDQTDLDSFAALLEDNMIISHIKKSNYYEDLSILFASETKDVNGDSILGIDRTKLEQYERLENPATVLKKLYEQGSSKNTSAEIKTLFNAITEEQFNFEIKENSGNVNNKPSYSGGGGGGGALTLPVTSKPVIETNPKETEPEDVLSNGEIFRDIADVEWAHEAIGYLSEKTIINGIGNGYFAPNDFIKREEFVQMLDNAFGYSKAAFRSTFSDVDENAWYYVAISGASSSGIIKGYEDNTFGVGNCITREDAVVILSRAAGKSLLVNDGKLEFKDRAEISDYAVEAVDMFSRAGIVSGMENGRFAPKANLTRAEAAKLFYELLIKLEQ